MHAFAIAMSMHYVGTLQVMAMIMLTYLLPDPRSKPDHSRVIKLVHVSYIFHMYVYVYMHICLVALNLHVHVCPIAQFPKML